MSRRPCTESLRLFESHSLAGKAPEYAQTGRAPSGYGRQKALIACKAAQARDFTNRCVRRAGEIDDVERVKNSYNSMLRARVEHVLAAVKRLWGFTKVRYGGLVKSAARSFMALALANIYLARGSLMA